LRGRPKGTSCGRRGDASPLHTPEIECVRFFYGMARYEHLPIYKQAMDVAIHFEKVASGFSRYHKYTLGIGLRNANREIVSLIVQANSP